MADDDKPIERKEVSGFATGLGTALLAVAAARYVYRKGYAAGMQRQTNVVLHMASPTPALPPAGERG